jgi:tetratricopeptide (TPR) repeat protein
MQSKKKATKVASSSGWSIAFVAVALAGSVAAQSTKPTRGAAAAGPQGTSAQLANLPATRRFRDAMVDSGDFNAALKPALDTVAAQAGARDAAYSDDLSVLARIEAELGQYDKAEATYLQAIDALQTAEGEFTLSLMGPYRGLGRSYIKAGLYPEAITALETARNISQRNLGLFNVEQSPLLDDITTAYLGLGDTRAAQKIQLERLDNAVKRYGANDQRVIPYRYVLADYYQRSRLPDSARQQYTEVLKTQESRLGPEHPGLLNPLRQLVRIDLLTDQTQAGEAHARLVRVLQENPNTDALERGESLATLGDWAIVADDFNAARDYYKQAWDAFSSAPGFDVAAAFAKPEMIDFIAPLSSVDRGEKSRLPYGWAEIDFSFDVAADGRPQNVKVMRPEGAQPSEFEPRYSRRLRETHFRPRLVAGEPVATESVQFTHYFRVYVAPKKKRAEPTADQG